MDFIKQEPLSEEQWDHFIKEFENQPEAYFSDYQNTLFDQNGLSANDTNTQGLSPAAGQVKSGAVNPQADWTFMDPTNPSFERPADNESRSNISSDQVMNKLEEIRALYGHCTLLRIGHLQGNRLEDNTR